MNISGAGVFHYTQPGDLYSHKPVSLVNAKAVNT